MQFPVSFDFRWVAIIVVLNAFTFAIVGAVLLSFDSVADRYERFVKRISRMMTRSVESDDT